MVHEMLPKPERRQDNENSRKGTSPIISSTTVTTPADLLIKRPKFNVEYPSEVIVLQNASFLARVAEPKENLTDSRIT